MRQHRRGLTKHRKAIPKMANLAFKDIYDDIQLFEREGYEQMLAECDQSGFHYLIGERGQLQVDVDEGPETDALWPVFQQFRF